MNAPSLPPGTRVRILPSSPWPARVGLTATVVAPASNRTYPQPAPWEVILKVDDDPFALAHETWSCVMSKKDVQPLRLETRTR